MRGKIFKNVAVSLLLILGLCTVLQFGHKASAVFVPDPSFFGNDSPPDGSGRFDPGCTSANNGCYESGSSVNPFYVVGNNAQEYTYATMSIKIYVQRSPSSTIFVYVNNASPQCHQYTSGVLTGPDYTNAGGAPNTQFKLSNASVVFDTQSENAGDCGTQKTFSVPSGSASAMNTPTTNFDGYFVMTVSIPPQLGNEGENSFTVTATGGAVGYMNGSGDAGLGFRANDINNGNHWNAWATFAPPVNCSNYDSSSSVGGSIGYKDMDIDRIDWNTQMILELQSQLVNSDGTVTGNSWNLEARTIQPPAGSMGQNGSLAPPGGFQYNHRYRIILANIGVRNTIRINPASFLDGLYSDIPERPNDSKCKTNDGATCSGSDITVDYTEAGKPQTVNITATNVGSSTWTSSYYMKRISPSFVQLNNVNNAPVTHNETSSFTDTVNAPAAGNSITLLYKMFNPTGTSFNSDCPVTIKTLPKPTAAVTSCTASMSSPTGYNNNTIPSGAAPHIHVNVTNGTSTTYLANVYTVRQIHPAWAVAPNGPTGGSRYLTRNLTKGQTDTRIPDFLINARTTTTQLSITFFYNLFPDDTAGANPIAPGTNADPLCRVTITWKAGATGCTSNCGGASSATIQAACGQTTIGGVFVPATYHPFIQPPGTPPPPQIQDPTGRLITIVPAKVHVTDQQDQRSWDYYIDVGNNGGVKNGTSFGNGAGWQGNTFDMGSGNQMWPHHTYHFELFLEGTASPTDSYSYQNSGAWGSYGSDSNPISTADSPGDCLSASCLAGSSPDLEPGQNADLSGGIHFDNRTSADGLPTNSTSAYSIHVDISGGYGATPDDPIGTDNTIGRFGGTDVRFTFTTTISYQVTYSWTLQFQGSNLELGQGGTCNTPPVTPSTRPYFQVWGGDINTGGGFEKQDPTTGAFTCPSSYPDYVSPSAPGLPGGIPRDYGGIKAFGAADGTYGSMSDFGALSLGIIAKNDAAHINFHANPSFSSVATPSSSGGELNSSSPNYCVIDFFDKTQQSPNSIGTPSDINGLDNNKQDMVNNPIGGLGGGNVNANDNKVLYVNGDVTITSNIVYQSWNVDTQKPPSFVLIVRGNINVAPNVTRLDGLYIAQPTASAVDGIFNTCANNIVNQFCNQQLIVNGAVIARRIMPLRSVGTLSPDANPSFSPPPGHNAAEIFNFVPSMVLSNPNFTPIYSNLQGLFSLPPVF